MKTLKTIHVKNFRKGLATNSSSTHSIIYRNPNDVFEDLGVFENDYFDRCTENIAATREAKIKYIFHCIWHNDSLVRKMSFYYPEMKQYYPLAKKAHESEDYDVFGEHCRGVISHPSNVPCDLDFDVDYLRHIIDAEDIVIVGGSDEMDFVYDTMEGHQLAPMGGDIYDWDYPYNKNGITKNGNYYVAYGRTFRDTKYSGSGRLRFMTEDGEPTPEYPELIDLRITNKCDHGCKFCFMGSTMSEKHADVHHLFNIVNSLPKRTEFSIGGGNILLYPELEKLFSFMQEKGHVINVTINVDDCDKVLHSKKLMRIFKKYVDGIGVSVFNGEDAKKLVGFENAFKDVGTYKDVSGYNRKYITAHTIPEYIGVENVVGIKKALDRHFIPLLYLGYKENGRGANCEYHRLSENDLDKMFSEQANISVDTLFVKRYGDYIKKNFSTKYCLTENEGEYSMYIDGVTMNAYKSSYDLEKPYYIGYEDVAWDKRLTVKDAFSRIREDGGFPVYHEKHYWD